MPNPTLIHPESSKIRHFLAIADFYIQAGKPEIYEVEPTIAEEYRPDAYMRLGEPIIVEVQRTRISVKRMQDKVDWFAKTHKQGKHDAKSLWIVTDVPYPISIPIGYKVKQIAGVI